MFDGSCSLSSLILWNELLSQLLNAFNSQDFSVTDVKFAAKVVDASNPLGSQNPESRCVQQLEFEGGNECVRYESHFKCLVPAQGVTS